MIESSEDGGKVVQALVEIPAGDVHPERQRQTGLEQPPLAQVEHLVQSVLLVGELALVDHETGVGAPRRDLVEDPVERQLAVGELPEREAEGEERRRHPAGDDDLGVAQLVEHERLACDEDGPVAGADARAVRQQRVAVLDEGIRVQRDRCRFQPALERPLVQRLDVLEHLLEAKAARVDRTRRERPEHEGVVGIRAVAEPDQHGARLAPTYTHAVTKVGLSDAIQDYLKEIYKLGTESERVSTSALARRQQVSDASASAMVKKLAALGLAEHAPYRGVTLTHAGEQVALEVIRHHRLLELYLAETLGIGVDDVHDEADRLEHALSEELEERIDKALGFPTHDPHGDPIPDANLEWPKDET